MYSIFGYCDEDDIDWAAVYENEEEDNDDLEIEMESKNE